MWSSTSNPHHSPMMPLSLKIPVWLAVFLSPTAYVLLLVIVAQLALPAPPAGLVVFLFCLIPFVALLACGIAVWRSNTTLGVRVSGLVLTVLAMLFQCGVWLVIIASVINAMIAPV